MHPAISADHPAAIIARLYASARAAYSDADGNVPDYIWKEVEKAADRVYQDHIRRVLRGTDGFCVPTVMRRGRPKTSPEIIAHVTKLKGDNLSWKEIAKAVNEVYRTDYTGAQVRDLDRKSAKQPTNKKPD